MRVGFGDGLAAGAAGAAVSSRSRSLPSVERRDRVVERRRCEGYVALGGEEIGVSGQGLDRRRGDALHREVRAERVTRDA